MKKSINFELAESLARLGCNQKTIAAALGFSESGFGNCKAHNEKLRTCLERGWNSLIVDVQVALTNRAMGPAKWESDPIKKARGLGLKGDTKCLLYLAEKLEPSTTRIEVSESKESPFFVKTFAEMVARGTDEEKPQEKKGKKE
jgi:hypothetical protein